MLPAATVEPSDLPATLVQEPGSDPLTPAPRESSTGASLAALIVDDEAIAALMLEGSLVARGHRVVVAVNGRAGLDAIDRDAPDLVFVDMEMPVMNGPEMVRRLRANEALTGSRLFVVGLTAHEDPAHLQRFRDAGCDRCVAKPVDQEDIDLILREALASRA